MHVCIENKVGVVRGSIGVWSKDLNESLVVRHGVGNGVRDKSPRGSFPPLGCLLCYDKPRLKVSPVLRVLLPFCPYPTPNPHRRWKTTLETATRTENSEVRHGPCVIHGLFTHGSSDHR